MEKKNKEHYIFILSRYTKQDTKRGTYLENVFANSWIKQSSFRCKSTVPSFANDSNNTNLRGFLGKFTRGEEKEEIKFINI